MVQTPNDTLESLTRSCPLEVMINYRGNIIILGINVVVYYSMSKPALKTAIWLVDTVKPMFKI